MTAAKLGWGESHGRWPAPAKLNLFLHITGRRHDGYHLLQTVFQLLDYGDELVFERREDDRVTLSIEPPNAMLVNEDNLVLRAALLLKQHAGKSGSELPGVNVTLYKNLPAGAGLGGGSSDAATTLVALNHLWQLGLGTDELAHIGLLLGADIPVFVRARSAWAEGVGEVLQPIELPVQWYVVLTPDVHVSTVELFAQVELTRDCTPITIRAFQDGAETCNVFEPLVCRLQPAVAHVLEELRLQADRFDHQAPRMTGTGSSVFLQCETRSGAQNVLDAVTDKVQEVRGFVAMGIEHSGLLHYR